MFQVIRSAVMALVYLAVIVMLGWLSIQAQSFITALPPSEGAMASMVMLVCAAGAVLQVPSLLNHLDVLFGLVKQRAHA